MIDRLGALSLLAYGTALSAQPAVTKLDAVAGIPPVDKVTQTEDVRFKNDLADRMTVPVKLSGSGPYRFLVDTGADRTAISRQLAGRPVLVTGRAKGRCRLIAQALMQGAVDAGERRFG